ncbi:hypothetical protein MU1_02170 [Paenibacillus glycanilyticus]|uniref:Uncharacterized protein n=1 Tax=Paenibacillus glycanilyticus TaxID=126569 RepID=A0ABQ6G6K8_9BACL|nr:hypothetical protein MU1_02170 [Paenibacillus glycanilyticus]
MSYCGAIQARAQHLSLQGGPPPKPPKVFRAAACWRGGRGGAQG